MKLNLFNLYNNLYIYKIIFFFIFFIVSIKLNGDTRKGEKLLSFKVIIKAYQLLFHIQLLKIIDNK